MIAYSLADPNGRSAEGSAEAAVLIADGQVYASASEDQAFDAWLALTEHLGQHMRPSARWQAVKRAEAMGRNAAAGDRRARSLPDYTNASTILELARDVLGPDAYAKLRQAAADRMAGREIGSVG